MTPTSPSAERQCANCRCVFRTAAEAEEHEAHIPHPHEGSCSVGPLVDSAELREQPATTLAALDRLDAALAEIKNNKVGILRAIAALPEREALALVLDKLPALSAAVRAAEAMVVMPEGVCACYGTVRDATKPDADHVGECRDFRAALAAVAAAGATEVHDAIR